MFTPTEFTVAELCDDMPVGFETVSYSRLDLPYTQIQCQTEDKQTERVRLVVVVSLVIRNHDF